MAIKRMGMFGVSERKMARTVKMETVTDREDGYSDADW
jgi:hypothetical protein